jgi:hypothetical protein
MVLKGEISNICVTLAHCITSFEEGFTTLGSFALNQL